MELVRTSGMNLEGVTLGSGEAVAVVERERGRLRDDELLRIVSEVLEMFRRLNDELLVGRRGALSLMAELGGLLEEKLDRVIGLRGEGAGRGGDDGAGLSEQLERLERGLSYLGGFFGVLETSERTWCLDRVEIRSSLRKVWPIVEGLEKRLTEGRSEIDLKKCSLV